MKAGFYSLLVIIGIWISSPNLTAQPFSLDTTFNLQYDFVRGFSRVRGPSGIKQFSDGSMLVFGGFAPYSSPNYQKIVKFQSNGNLDFSFQLNTNISWTNGGVGTLYDITEGYLIHKNTEFYLKIDTNGNQVDIAWFDTLNYYFSPSSWNLFNYPDGSILMPCLQCKHPKTNPTNFFNLVRVTPSGHYDSTFTHDVNGVSRIFKYSDTELMIAGQFSHYDTIYTPYICKIDTSGNIDPNWNSIIRNGIIENIFGQIDGKIILFGSNLVVNGINDTTALLRINSDGSLDSTFNNFNSVYNIPNTVSVIATACKTTDGGYLFGGHFEEYEGVPRKNIVKADADGYIEAFYMNNSAIDSIDPATAGLGIPPFVGQIEKSITGDAYYVMGAFLKYGNNIVKPIIRIHGLTVGLEENTDNITDFTISPNPNSGSFQITYTPLPENLHLQVFNILGKEVHAQILPQWSQLQNIHIGNVPAGVYMATITSSAGKKSIKFVVE